MGEGELDSEGEREDIRKSSLVTNEMTVVTSILAKDVQEVGEFLRPELVHLGVISSSLFYKLEEGERQREENKKRNRRVIRR